MRFSLLAILLFGLVGCSEFLPRDEADTVVIGPEEDTTTRVSCGDTNCDDSDPCTTDRCDLTIGACVYDPKPAGATCDDGLYCTVEEQCMEGLCLGVTRPCPGGAQGCLDGVCNEAERTCEMKQSLDGSACEDDNLCTIGDQCKEGVCLPGLQATCDEPAELCKQAICEPASGECKKVDSPDMSPCNDGVLCTGEDQCLAGQCVGSPVSCANLDEGCLVGVCEPATGDCQAQPAEDGSVCSDDDACTKMDSCVGGVCAGQPLDCSGLDQTCAEGACDAGTGECMTVPAAEGANCSDGDECTLEDTCQTGVCIGLDKDCSFLNGTCVAGLCDSVSGVCLIGPSDEGGDCDDGNNCTVQDSCNDGVCLGEPMDCSSSAGPCEKGSCIQGVCVVTPDDSLNEQSCDDGIFCTDQDVCFLGVCVGSPRDCSAADGLCLTGTCNEQEKVCESVPQNDGNLCELSGGSAAPCKASVCLSGACTEVADSGQNLQACDDGLFCTQEDFCLSGVCTGGTPVNCSSLDQPCQTGICDEEVEGCLVSLHEAGSDCDDGDLCTTDDGCLDGFCEGEPTDCTSWNAACVAGQCEPSTGQCTTSAVPDGSLCDDGLECTIGDTCQAGGCSSGVPTECACVGTSASLSFSGGCASIPVDDVLLEAESGFTIEFWLRTTSQVPGIVLDQRISGSLGENDWYISFVTPSEAGQLRFHYGNVTNSDSLLGMNSGALNDGEWHHVAVVRDNTTVRWWVDGVGSFGNVVSNMKSLSNDAPLVVGCSSLNGASPFVGEIDELRISTYARYTVAFDPPGRHYRDLATVGLWHFDETAGTMSFAEGSGAGYTGMLSGAVDFLSETAIPLESCCGDGVLEVGEECDDLNGNAGDGCSADCLEEAGLPARSLKLDGVGDCVHVDGSGLLSTVGSLTIAFWLKADGNDSATLLDKTASSASGEISWAVQLRNDGRVAFVTAGASGQSLEFLTAQSVTDQQWHHLLFSRSTLNVVRWYVDGQSELPGLMTGLSAPGNHGDLYIGCAQGTDAWFAGHLDNIHIFAAETTSLDFEPSNVVVPSNSTELLFGFDVPALGGQVLDLSSGLHVGTLLGEAALSDETP